MFANAPELITTFRDNIFLPDELRRDYENDILIAQSPTSTPLQRWWADVFCNGINNNSGGLCFEHATEITVAEYDANPTT